jgi:uncharacterized repeat protein (TIGR01451 family)
VAINLSAASVRAGALLLALLLGLLFLPVLLQAGQEQPSQAGGWTIDCPDCPKLFSSMTDRSLRLDAAGRPHVAYGQDHLYYAWHDGVAWRYETADASPGVGIYASLALDGGGSPHISYWDETTGDLHHATGCFPPDLSPSAKRVSPSRAAPGDRLTYTLDVANAGHKPTMFTLTDGFSLLTTYVPGSAWASTGTLTVTAGISLIWTGAVDAGAHQTATYAVTVAATITWPTVIVNKATLSGDPSGPHGLSATVMIRALRFYLPLIVKDKDWEPGKPTPTPRPSPPPTPTRPRPSATPSPP